MANTGITKSSLVCLSVVAVGVFVRVLGTRGELWLDEITSLMAVTNLSDFSQIVTTFRSDNNHFLNSVWLWLLGANQAEFSYRLLSLLGGIGSLLLIWRTTLVQSERERLILLTLYSLSYPLILYSSEARGYSTMIFFSLSALEQSASFFRKQGTRSAFWVWLSFIGALLSHLSAIQMYGAVILASMYALRNNRRAFFLLHSVPFIILIAWYFAFIRYLPESSGSIRSYGEVLMSALSLGGGGPGFSPLNPQASLLACGVAVAMGTFMARGLGEAYRTERSLFLLFLSGVLLVPVMVLIVLQPRLLYERYLLFALVCGYFLIARALAVLWETTSLGKWIVGVLIAAYLTGHLARTSDLIRYHRGSYSETIKYILSHSRESLIPVSVDQKFRNETLLSYFGSRIDSTRKFQVSTVFGAVEWRLNHSQDPNFIASEVVLSAEGSRYRLVQSSKSAELSGWAWYLYQRESEGNTQQ